MTRTKQIRQRQLLVLLLCFPVVQSVLAQSASGARNGPASRAGIAALAAQQAGSLIAAHDASAVDQGKAHASSSTDFLPGAVARLAYGSSSVPFAESERVHRLQEGALESRFGRAPPSSVSF